MHHYFLDSSLNAPRYAKDIARIETRLTDLGIKGKVTRLTPLHDLSTCVKKALAESEETLVAVGSDAMLSRLVSFLRAHPRLTIGTIPLGAGPRMVSRVLGIPEGLPACDTLAARRLEALDAGIIDNTALFISSAEVCALPCALECDRKFSIRESSPLHAVVQNLISFQYPSRTDCPTDGRFTVRLAQISPSSFFRAQSFAVHTAIPARMVRITPTNGDVTVTIDGFRRARAPLTLEVLPRHLNFIVGKERNF